MLVLCSKEKSHLCFKNLSFSYESKIKKKKKLSQLLKGWESPTFSQPLQILPHFYFGKKVRSFFMSFAFLTFYV